MLTIGNVTLENNVILAPMAGITDLPFRVLCREYGAGLVCMEMISAKAIYYGNKGTEKLLTIAPEEMPVSLQLFGNDADIMAEMAKRIEDRPFAILDINMGCPVPKVVNNGEGSALMTNPKLVAEIVGKVSRAISKPVTVKIRKGFDEDHVNAVEIAHIAEESGAAAVAVHGRTREQLYSGRADWDIIARVKNHVKTIPVIGNGDVTDAKSAGNLIKTTNCDGVMVGRGAMGNPFVFGQIARYLETGELLPGPQREEILRVVLRHMQMQRDFKGDYTAVREMRTHLAHYTAGFRESSSFRSKVNHIEDMDELVEEVTKFFTE